MLLGEECSVEFEVTAFVCGKVLAAGLLSISFVFDFW